MSKSPTFHFIVVKRPGDFEVMSLISDIDRLAAKAKAEAKALKYNALALNPGNQFYYEIMELIPVEESE